MLGRVTRSQTANSASAGLLTGSTTSRSTTKVKIARPLRQDAGVSKRSISTASTKSIASAFKVSKGRGLASVKRMAMSTAVSAEAHKPVATNRQDQRSGPETAMAATIDASGPTPTAIRAIIPPSMASTSTPPAYITPTTLALGLDHLRSVDPRLGPWIDSHDFSKLTKDPFLDDPPLNPFKSLAQGIIFQQLSGTVANSILTKFLALFQPPSMREPAVSTTTADIQNTTTTTAPIPDPSVLPFPTPSEVLSTPLTTLRSAGLSGRKAEYMHSLSQHFLDDPLLCNPAYLRTATDADIITALTCIHGIGTWTAEMFLIFQLHRADVFSIGDLGIQRGMARLVGKDAAKNPAVKSNKWKYMAEKDMREMSETFKPYRTLFSLLMYKVSDQAVEKEKEKAKGKAKGKRKAKAKVEEKEEKEEGS